VVGSFVAGFTQSNPSTYPDARPGLWKMQQVLCDVRKRRTPQF
jgi:hypothetical protein